MSSELGAAFCVIVEEFSDAPCDAESVERAGTASDFVEKDEAAEEAADEPEAEVVPETETGESA